MSLNQTVEDMIKLTHDMGRLVTELAEIVSQRLLVETRGEFDNFLAINLPETAGAAKLPETIAAPEAPPNISPEHSTKTSPEHSTKTSPEQAAPVDPLLEQAVAEANESRRSKREFLEAVESKYKEVKESLGQVPLNTKVLDPIVFKAPCGKSAIYVVTRRFTIPRGTVDRSGTYNHGSVVAEQGISGNHEWVLRGLNGQPLSISHSVLNGQAFYIRTFEYEEGLPIRIYVTLNDSNHEQRFYVATSGQMVSVPKPQYDVALAKYLEKLESRPKNNLVEEVLESTILDDHSDPAKSVTVKGVLVTVGERFLANTFSARYDNIVITKVDGGSIYFDYYLGDKKATKGKKAGSNKHENFFSHFRKPA